MCVIQEFLNLQVSVAVGSIGIATQDFADFFYIDKWSSPWTWGGNPPPVDGDFVVIQQVNFSVNITINFRY